MVSELAFGVAVGVLGTLIAAYLWPKIADRVSVHRVQDPNEDGATGLIELYDTLFSEDPHHYSSEEILQFIDASESFGVGRISQAENICLVAKFHGNVVGFLICHYYRQARKAIISYYGIDRQVPQARKHVGLKLLRKMIGLLRRADRPCGFVLFELERAPADASGAASRRARSRALLFRQRAKKIGVVAYELDFPYTCPRVSVSEESEKLPATLFCVPLSGRFDRFVPRKLVLEWLRFVHKDCYGDLYRVGDECFARHHEELDLAMRGYEVSLPEQVRVR